MVVASVVALVGVSCGVGGVALAVLVLCGATWRAVGVAAAPSRVQFVVCVCVRARVCDRVCERVD